MDLNNLTSFIPEASSPSHAPVGGANHLAAEVQIKGTLRFESELLFDGKIEGEVFSDTGTLTIGKNASIIGEVRTKSVTIYGTVEGNVTVAELCDLKADSSLTGDLCAARLTIEDGAVFVGRSDVTSNRVASGKTTAASGNKYKPSVVQPKSENSATDTPASSAENSSLL